MPQQIAQPTTRDSALTKIHERAAARRRARLELPPAVAAFLTDAATAEACLEMAEGLARVIRRNMAAVHVGTDPALLHNVSAEEVDLQLYRELQEGTARQRAEEASSDSGQDLDVFVMGGGAVIGSALAAGLLDALTVHLAPVVLGGGTPLFTRDTPRTQLTQRSVIQTSAATHLTYEVG